MTGLEIKGRLDRIGKTALEHFQDIKELELADEQLGVTVEYMFPYKCKQVEKSLKALEIIKPLCEVVETPVKKYRYLKVNGVVVYTFKTEEEYDLFKEVLE